MTDKLKVGIIGLGGRAKGHCKAMISNGIELVGVADPVDKLCREFMNEFNANGDP